MEVYKVQSAQPDSSLSLTFAMTLLSSALLYFVAPLFAVLAYLHHSAVREEAEKKRTKFNADYDPAQTDCRVELPFTKAGVEEVTLYLGQTVATSCGI